MTSRFDSPDLQATMTQFTFHFLGKFEVCIGTEVVTEYRSDKVRALLAYLALEPKPHARAELATLLWPEIGDKYARANLRNTLHRLRHSLDTVDRRAADQLLTVTRQSVQVNATNAFIDVHRFESLLNTASVQTDEPDESSSLSSASRLAQLVKAVGLYQGELLAGFGVADAPGFEEWLLLRREMLQQRMLLALHSLTTGYEALEEYGQAHAMASRLLALDPYREESYHRAMRLLALCSQPDQALQLFEQMRQLLRNDLDVNPSEETLTLAKEIAAGKFDKVTSDSQNRQWQGDKVTQAELLTPSPSHLLTFSNFLGKCSRMSDQRGRGRPIASC